MGGVVDEMGDGVGGWEQVGKHEAGDAGAWVRAVGSWYGRRGGRAHWGVVWTHLCSHGSYHPTRAALA